MAYRHTNGHRANPVSPNRRRPNRTPAWMAIAGATLAILTALTVPLASTFPAGAAVPKGSVPANWNSDPNASCGSWHQATPPGAGYVGTLSLSGGGGGIGGADQFPPFDYTLPAGGQGGLVSTGVVTEGSTVSVFTACGGRNKDTSSGGAGYGAGGSAGTGTQEDGYDGGSGGGASILCLGSVTSSSGCTTPLVIAGGGGGTGAGYDCGTADGWAGGGGTAGTGSPADTNGWDVASGQSGSDGFGVADPPDPPPDLGDFGDAGGGGSATQGGGGGSGPGYNGDDGAANFPGQSTGGGGGNGHNAGGGGGGGGYTSGGGGGGDYCVIGAAAGGGGGGGASGINLGYSSSASFTGGANGAVQLVSPNSCTTGGNTYTQDGGCPGYVSLEWTPASTVPSIKTMLPNSGPESGNGTVTFTGSNLAPVSAVTFGDSADAKIVSQTPNKVEVTVPPESIFDYGEPSVGVELSTVGGTAYQSYSYTTSPSAPTVTSMVPNFGPMAGGTEVVLTGTNLAGATHVGMGFTDSMKIVSDTATKIVASTPAENEGAYSVPVTTPTGGTLAPTDFTVYGTPVVTTTSLPSTQVGEPYSAALSEKGAAPPVTWSIASGGTLQTGLSLDPGTGVISGTPSVAGWATLRYKVVDADNLSGESGDLILKVNALPTATSATIMPLNDSYGAPVTFQATVTSSSGTPTGTVAFTSGATPLCTATLVTGTDSGSCSTSTTAVGTDQTVTATYSGDSMYSESSSRTGGFDVGKSTTTTNVTANPSTTSYGTEVSYSAQVVPPYSGAGIAPPTGNVVFTSGPITLCSTSVSNGSATCTGGTPTPGPTAVVTATYAGDGNYHGSTGTTPMDVSKGQASVTSSVFRPNLTYGETATYYAYATAPAGTPTGSVTFVTEGGMTLCTATLSAGSGSCTSNAAGPAGAIVVYANYSGDANFAAITDSYATRSVIDVSATTPIVKVSVDPILSVFGAPQTYSAKLLGSGPLAPTGTVTFSVNGTDLCSASLAKGSASCAPPLAPGGMGYTVVATYSGDDDYLGAQGQATTTVFAAPTTTVTHATPNRTVFGQSVSYSATVSSSVGTPTGTVNFTDGSSRLCTASLSVGTASCTSSTAPVGVATATATYTGNADFASSAMTTPITVDKAQSITTPSVNPPLVAYGSSVTYGVVVTGQFSGTPTGTVTFMTGTTGLCAATLAGGSASCTSTKAPGGTDTITATYSGDANFIGSTSSIPLTVVQAPTTAKASADPVTITYANRVGFSATVNGPDAAPVGGGTVQFVDGTDVLCLANVSGSEASCSSDQARIGLDQTITAVYGGTANYATTLATTTLNVTQAATKTTVSITPQPAVYASPVTFAARVTAPAGAFPKNSTPTGSVSFSIGALPLCTATISDGTGSCRASNAPIGAGQLVSAVYSGDQVYPSSTGTASLSVASGPGRCSSTAEGSASVPGGYWLAGANGAVYSCGDAPFYGSLVTLGVTPTHPIIGMAATPNGRGYWLVASDGGIFAFGDAVFYGSMGGKQLNRPVVGMAALPGGGYYEVASDGGVFSFGPGAAFYGSEGGKPLNAPVVGMDAAKGGGYRLVASDGGIFSFGPGASFYGSMGGHPLNKPIVGMATTVDGGYWLVASDGGIFSFGPGASFYGSMGGHPLKQPIVGMAAPTTGGYWLVASDGGIFTFGSARFAGSTARQRINDIGGMAAATQR